MNTSKDDLMRSIHRRAVSRRAPPRPLTNGAEIQAMINDYLSSGGGIHRYAPGDSGLRQDTATGRREDEPRVPPERMISRELFNEVVRKTRMSPRNVGFLRRCFVLGMTFEMAGGDSEIKRRAPQLCELFWDRVRRLR